MGNGGQEKPLSSGDIGSLAAAIVESSQETIVCTNALGIITLWNPAAEKMFGYPAYEALGQSIRLIVPRDLHREEDDLLGRLSRGETVESFETVRWDMSGRRLEVLISASPLRNAAGSLVGVSRIMREIGAVKRDGALLHAIVASSEDAIVSKTLDGIITSWNPGAEHMFGYTAEEAIGQSIRIIIPPELQAEEDYILGQIRHGRRIQHFETVRQAKDGHRIDISLSISPTKDRAGVVNGAAKIARDITGRTRAQSLLSAIVASSDDAIISKSLDGTITSWNSAAERMFGYSASQAIGQSIRMIVPPELQSEEDHVLDQLRRGEKVDHYETVRAAKDGHRINVSLTISPIRDAAGRIVGASKIARDITDQIKLAGEREAAMDKLSETLAGRDEFIAIAAHELRNPLNVLNLLWRLMNRSVADATAIDPTLLDRARRQLAYVSSLVDRLLDMTRIRSGTFDLYLEKFNLSELIGEIADRFSIDSQSRIVLEVDPHIDGTWDRIRIDQVITNLVTNAIKFGRKKPITVRASRTSDDAIVMVQDQGIGIAAENLERIFERFERAEVRSDSEGLGMGLWITKQIVRAHGGMVVVDTELGKGSTFTVRLPLETTPEAVEWVRTKTK